MLELTPLQHTLITCVRHVPGTLRRSALAKLLVGSPSMRVEHLSHNPYFGLLAGRSRKEILHQVDVLLQQQLLALNRDGYLIVGRYAPEDSPDPLTQTGTPHHVRLEGAEKSDE